MLWSQVCPPILATTNCGRMVRARRSGSQSRSRNLALKSGGTFQCGSSASGLSARIAKTGAALDDPAQLLPNQLLPNQLLPNQLLPMCFPRPRQYSEILSCLGQLLRQASVAQLFNKHFTQCCLEWATLRVD